MSASEHLSALAATKKNRKEGYALYARVAPERKMSEQEEYYLTWTKSGRAWSSSVTTTETYHSEIRTSHTSDAEMNEARRHLRRLEDLAHRIEAARNCLEAFGTRARGSEWKLKDEEEGKPE